MKSRIGVSILVLFLGAGLYLAGQNKRGYGAGQPSGQPAASKDIFTVEGLVTEVSLGIGQGSPAIVVGQQRVVLGPYRFLEAAGFSVEVGDSVSAQVFESLVYEGLLIAVQVENRTRDLAIDLRDASGDPLWTSARGYRGQRSTSEGGRSRSNACPGPLDLSAALSITGKVQAVTGGAGQRNPEIILEDGTVLAAGPYRVWLEGSFTLAEGETATFTAVPCAGAEGKLVILSIEKPNGEKLVLRDDTGIPVSGRGWRAGSCSRNAKVQP